ncbi:CRISPR-associated endonuclease Cas1 [Endomicrobium proavitum]|nr:CRISPR-associated endonuclease Cas1 [Endomicrobium proavitum]
MNLNYIKTPQKFVQPDLFSSENFIYANLDAEFPLFFDTLVHWQFNENLFYLVSKDLSHLIVSGYGVHLSKKSERLIIKDNKKCIYELPFFRLKTVAIMSKGIGISSDLIEEFSKAQINLSFHDFSAKPHSLLQSLCFSQHADLKRRQILAQNSKTGISFMAAVVCGKISNQAAVLKYCVKNIKPDKNINIHKLQTAKEACAQMQQCYNQCLALSRNISDIFEARQKFMGYEGTAARIYWNAISAIISEKIEFSGRQTKPLPKDAVNTLLNYGYGILYSKIWSAAIIAGLDPYVGFLHTDQSGKPALIFDLIEEFRAPIVDRAVIAFIMLNRNIQITQNLLDIKTREKFSEKIIEQLTSAQYYEGQKVMVSDIILSQARKLVAFIEERQKEYSTFSFKW